MRIGLFVKENKLSNEYVNGVIEKIKSHNHVFDNENPQYVLSLGGDGTFLQAVHKYLDILDQVIFICVNKGNLGYFSDFLDEDLDDVLSNLDNYVVNRYRLLSTSANGETIYAVNEIRIENPFHTLKSEVFINNEYLESFRGNGLVVSTALGSTAYNKSLGGAIVDLSLEIMQMSEIAPINNCMFESLKSSLVLPDSAVIKFKGDFASVVIGYDYLVKKDYKSNEIEFRLSDKKVALLNKKDHSNTKKLNKSFIERR